MGDKQEGSKRMNGEVPKEREAGICVPKVGAEEKDTPQRGAKREVRTAGELGESKRTENW